MSAGEGGFSRPPHEATRVASIALLLLLLFVSALTFAQVAVPPLTAPVIDQTQTLTPAQIASLEQTIRAFYERKGSQITVLMVPTTQPEAIEQYSIRVVESWKLGRANIDDGALLLVAKDDRTVRIEVGYGLEGALPDVIANRIVQQVIVPRRGPPGATAAGTGGVPGAKVSLAIATVDQLGELPGIGPVTAQKIVDWRSSHGPFQSVDDLDDVPGIGPARIEQLRDLVTP